MNSLKSFLQSLLPSLALLPPPDIPLKGHDPDRIPISSDYDHFYELPDGRTMCYTQYGSPTGKPVFFIHGLPGCRLEGAYFHQIALKHNARIIAPDRPGHGLSSPHPERKLLDYPKDIENLANHLGFKEFGMMGASGAGPSMLACAYALPPSQLKCTSLICCLGPANEIGHKGGTFMHKLAFPVGWRISPSWLVAWTFKWILMGPMGRHDLPAADRVRRMLAPEMLAKHHPKDLPFMSDEDVLWTMCKTVEEAWGRSFVGGSQDGAISCSPWGFRIEDIREDLPIHMWYGKIDVFVPIDHGNQIAARLGGRAEYHVVDETHTSVFFNYKEQALQDVLKTF